MPPFGSTLANVPSGQRSKVSDTNSVEVAATGISKIVSENYGVSYVEIQNQSDTDTIRYGYVERDTLPEDGFRLKPGQVVSAEGGRDIFAAIEAGSTGPVKVGLEFGQD